MSAPWTISEQHTVTGPLAVLTNTAASTNGRARDAVSAVLARHSITDGARIRLTAMPHRGLALIQVNLRVYGAPARIQVAGADTDAAITAGADRLDRQLQRITTAWEQWPWPDPQRRALDAPGPGRIVRVKRHRVRVRRACQAAAEMAAMDFDAYLFTDSATGEDAIVFRAGPTGLRLARQHSMHPPVTPHAIRITAHPQPTPTLTTYAATNRLTTHGLPYLFFTDSESGRGNLLYRRYDTDLGLISPADAPTTTGEPR